MANINEVALCPYCSVQLPGLVERCPACQRKLQEYKSPYFNSVDTITAQYSRGSTAMYGDARKRNGKYFVTGNPERSSYHAEMLDYYRKASPDSRVMLVRETLLMMQSLLNADDHSLEAMRSIVFTAKRIGDIANAVEHYLKSGGSLATAKNPYHTFTLDNETWEATGQK